MALTHIQQQPATEVLIDLLIAFGLQTNYEKGAIIFVLAGL